MDSNTTLQPITYQASGKLKIDVTSSLGLIPIQNARITILSADSTDTPIESTNTNISGQTDVITLPSPALEYSISPSEVRPYAEYDILIEAAGYEPTLVQGTQILPDVTAIQPVSLTPVEIETSPEESIFIPDHTLYGTYPPKIPEAEVKPLDETGEIVLSRVVIPEYVVVHDGAPTNTSAQNYYVRYADYIKNVACNEIYSTWPENAIYANILAIMSFTLNRVYTEWYRNRGYSFTITSSTAYDQKWVYGRNIYENIDYLVDSVFSNYLSRPGISQPILTSYCDGRTVTCDGLSQWGSKYLADEGYSAIEILRYYYGNTIYINTTDTISGVPSSFPGTNLSVGSSGTKVTQMQEQLLRIRQNYPAIPAIAVDGIYGPRTQEAVRVFQSIFNLPQTGIVDFATWYAISNIYVGVTRIAEPGAY